ncbi:hypothetical protein [Geminicoccus harenae]|uniref:hypothetical protein n=1 Tax=Geminicoccus harenae TaxID=2498453 RepID=UPI00168BBF96|nr:hypothetical protein [Geminicoccus harenae]
MPELLKVIRKRPGLLTPINGVKFEPYEDASISETISREMADLFLAVPGYVLNGAVDPDAQARADEAAAAGKREADAIAAAKKEADEKAAKEAAEKEAADAAAKEAADKEAADAAAKEAADKEAADKAADEAAAKGDTGKESKAKGARAKAGDNKPTSLAEGSGEVF